MPIPSDELYGRATGLARPAVRRPGGNARLSTGNAVAAPVLD
ncbi:MAG: hypothetical protein ABSA80_05835 [Terriglobales bacterium]|jgi:hypothetical protein